MPLVITLPKKGNMQQCQNYRTISLISQPSKVMLKIIDADWVSYIVEKTIFAVVRSHKVNQMDGQPASLTLITT